MSRFLKARYHLFQLENNNTQHDVQRRIHSTCQRMLEDNPLPLPTPTGNHLRGCLTQDWRGQQQELLVGHLKHNLHTLGQEILNGDLTHWQHCLQIAQKWISKDIPRASKQQILDWSRWLEI